MEGIKDQIDDLFFGLGNHGIYFIVSFEKIQ
jgi:hypothetical protein